MNEQHEHKFTHLIVADVHNNALSISRLRRMEASCQQAKDERDSEYDEEYHASIIEALNILQPDQTTRDAYRVNILRHKYTLTDLQAMARVHRELGESLDDPYYLGLNDAIKSLQADEKQS